MINAPPRLDQESLAVVALWSLSISFERRLGLETEKLGLSVSSFRLIGEVMQEPNGIRQGELAKRLGVRPPTVSAAVARLEERGMVWRKEDPDDPRARRVHLCANAPVQPGFALLTGLEEVMLAGMSPEERTQARNVLRTLSQRLEQS
jgi:DNA-binding MarR family transcriptional regulator